MANYDYLCFTALKATTLQCVTNDDLTWANRPVLYYKKNTDDWTRYYYGATISMAVDDKCYWKGDNPTSFNDIGTNSTYYVSFSTTDASSSDTSTWDTLDASGSIMSLIDSECNSLVIPNAYCFYGLFSNCLALRTAPELSATTLTSHCYMNMFDGCNALLYAPSILPATELVDNCYAFMFRYCFNLITTPTLPATTLANSCYQYMFYDCERITSAPALPATTLARQCYSNMFATCISLATAPALPATELAQACYYNMFKDCWALRTGPALNATTLVDSCYYGMFDMAGIVDGYTAQFTSVSINQNATLAAHCFQNMFKSCTKMVTAPPFPCDSLKDYCFSGMFMGTSIITTPNFSDWADKPLGISCFSSMFEGCEKLTSITGTLSWTTMTRACYQNMFKGCKLLPTAPALPATTLAPNCYYGMFEGCTNIETAPTLPAATMANSCYANMFKDCTAISTPPTLPAITLAYACYQNMFKGCVSLTTAPALPAITMVIRSYNGMFEGCTNLTAAPILAAKSLATGCCMNMFKGCTALVTVPALPAHALVNQCYQQMFCNCTSLQVNDAATNSTSYAWTIPASAAITTAVNQGEMFASCAGTRTSNDFTPTVGTQYTYYTQNEPVASDEYALHHAAFKIGVLSESKSYTIAVDSTPQYRIRATAINIAADASNPTAIKYGKTVILKYTCDGTNYTMPTTCPTITGNVTSSWNRISSTECTITLSNPTSEISFTITGVAIPSYSINDTHTNLTASSSNPTSVKEGRAVTLNYTANTDDYTMPTSITVGSTTVEAGTTKVISGVATFLYTRTDDANGKVYISSPEGNISYTIAGVAVPAYSITDTHTNLTAGSDNPTSIKIGKTATLYYTANGIDYKLPTYITVGSTNISAGNTTTVSGAATFTYNRTNDTSGSVYISAPEGNISYSILGEALGYTVVFNDQSTDPYYAGLTVKYIGASSSTTITDSGTYTNIISVEDYFGNESRSYANFYKWVNNAWVECDEPNFAWTLTCNVKINLCYEATPDPCFVAGSKVLLADGTTKNVEDITYDDTLTTWDFYNGNTAYAKPYWIKKEQTSKYWYQVTLENGMQIGLVGNNGNCHRLFNVTKQKMLYANECIGDEVYTVNGISKVISVEKIMTPVKFYNFKTEKYLDCFVNGILTGQRFNNMYTIDNMKYCSTEPLFTQDYVDDYETNVHGILGLPDYEGNFKVTIDYPVSNDNSQGV